MKLFGNQKKGDEKSSADEAEDDFFDSPSQMVSLSPVAKTGASAAPGAAPASSASASTTATPPATPPEEEPRTHYGIDAAIQLMRALPVDQNVELVVQVIKTTLESLKVRVSDIIQDASRKQKDIEERVSNLKRAISDFEREIETRKEEIGKLEADHSETTGVKERLQLAEKAQKAAAGGGASAATATAKEKPVSAGTGA